MSDTGSGGTTAIRLKEKINNRRGSLIQPGIARRRRTVRIRYFMPMIAARNIHKSYGLRKLLDECTFTINEGERVGLVGRNGDGKTTLLRILCGAEQVDEGEVGVPRGYHIALLEQQPIFREPTLLAEACRGLPPHERDHTWKAERVLSGLGFYGKDFEAAIDSFSGGFQMRLNLARVLVAEPDLLLLDEPTNFLDILSIRFLEKMLVSWRGELVMISHDRSFMDSVCTHVMGIHRMRLRKIKGATADYYGIVGRSEELYEKERQTQERKRRETEQFISRFRAKARQANLAQSRIRTLEKQQPLRKLEKLESLEFRFKYRPCPGKVLLEARDLSFRYSDDATRLFRGLSFAVGKKERLCVVGRNGTGKSTLLKVLAGGLDSYKGTIQAHPECRIGHFAQANTARLDPGRSVYDELAASLDTPNPQTVRDMCGTMMFSDDAALKRIGVLSGGEQCRVLLGRILLTPVNLLLLDEPTHHLDMESCEALTDAIDSFDGASIVVTHNEYMLRRLAARLIVFQQGNAVVFEGGYEQFLDEQGWDIEPGTDGACGSPEGGPEKLNRRDKRRLRAENVVKRSKILGPPEKKIQQLENHIAALEEQLSMQEQQLVEASHAGDAGRIVRLSQASCNVRDEIASGYRQLEEETTEYEKLKAQFDSEGEP